MPLSWNEIKHRAIKFGNEWKDESRESTERQTFWNDFFGLKRRTVASFEEPVNKLSGTWGAIEDAFLNDRARVKHLFALYEKLAAPLAPVAKKAKKEKPE